MYIGNVEVYGIIYDIRNKINNKHYIGQTTRNNGFNGRYTGVGKGIKRVYNFYKKQIKYNEKYNKHLYSSIEKYGLNSFEVIEIFDVAFSKKELDIKEKCWINIFDSFKNGYNETEGGTGNKNILNMCGRVGENHPLSKLTEIEVINIKKMLSEGIHQKEIVDKLGYSWGQIGRIANLSRWKTTGEEYNEKILSFKRPSWNDEYYKIIVDMRNDGKTYKEISDFLHIESTAIMKRYKDYVGINKYINCEICGKKVKVKSGRQKYCKDCAKYKKNNKK